MIILQLCSHQVKSLKTKLEPCQEIRYAFTEPAESLTAVERVTVGPLRYPAPQCGVPIGGASIFFPEQASLR